MNDEMIQELLSALYVQQLRIYDLLLTIGDKLGADMIAVKNLHASGEVFCPPPYLVQEESDEEA